MMKRLMFSILFSVSFSLVNSQEIKMIKVTDLEKTIANAQTPLIINFWATWCVPCIEEIPYFQEEARKHNADSLQLILVSLDMKETYPQKLTSFVQKRKITSTVQWLDETNADYFCPKVDEKWSGAIPASLFVNNNKGYRKFVEEQLSHDELKVEIKALLD